ncbi:hypothetical protein RZE84_05670 [Mollicutes bacterium LVI A0075]|nr:hypothetical protein RZE84_05670 [Mollicutes bacterium LVI A0075]
MNKGKLLALTLSVVGCIIFAITINQMKSYGNIDMNRGFYASFI